MQGDRRHVRYNVFSRQGEKALDLYQKAATLMKARPERDPLSWRHQASIHGSFWLTIADLEQNAAGLYGTKKQIRNGESPINTCTHFAGLWEGAK